MAMPEIRLRGVDQEWKRVKRGEKGCSTSIIERV